jgi:hypothetical protein
VRVPFVTDGTDSLINNVLDRRGYAERDQSA